MTAASEVVALSTAPALRGFQPDWKVALVGLGGELVKENVWRFHDGSMVTLTGTDDLPVEYVGGITQNHTGEAPHE